MTRMTSAEYRKSLKAVHPSESYDLGKAIKATAPKRKRMDREGPIQSACHDLMVSSAPEDCVYLSIPNEQMGGKVRGGRMNALGRMKGAADYWVIYQGIVTYIEFKCPKDVHGQKTYLKADQKAFRDMVTSMPNTRYAVCRSVEEFAIALRPLGLLANYRIMGELATVGRQSRDMLEDYRIDWMQS